MSFEKGLLSGKKFNHRHSSYIPEAGRVIKTARSLDEVSKIVLGVITSTKVGEPHLRITPIQAGIKVQVRGTCSVQLLYVYTSTPEQTGNSLQESFEDRSKRSTSKKGLTSTAST